MKLKQPFEGQVARIARDGSGEIPRDLGKPIRVYNTIPGETIKGTFIKRTPEAFRGSLDELKEASPDRVEPRCPYAGTCGGCKWQHVQSERQQSFKLELVQRAFTAHNIPCPIDHVESSTEPFYYRNRMDFVFGKNGSLGLKVPDRWWETLDLETCFLQSETSASIVNDVRSWAKASGMPFWDSRVHAGVFRYLVIREGKNTNERLVMLVTSATVKTDQIAGFAEVIGGRATSLLHGINPRLTDLSMADEIHPIRGNPWIHEQINATRYKITPNAFFQTNSGMAARLQSTVAEMAGSGGTLLDLYCGSGFFSLALAPRFTQTIGIELDAEAIACAQENAEMNGVKAEYFVSPAEAFDWTGTNPDVVIVDPPRAGMHPTAIETLLRERPPVVIYVSCNVERFVKEWVGVDGHVGLESAYRIERAVSLDLFPQTPHMECVFRLVRV